MMGYIVDFTIVVQNLFFLMQARTEASGSPSFVTERLFKIALDAYKQDVRHSLQKVHYEIRSFTKVKKAIFKSEAVIREVERLINVHRFKPSERFMEIARRSDRLLSSLSLGSSSSLDTIGPAVNHDRRDGLRDSFSSQGSESRSSLDTFVTAPTSINHENPLAQLHPYPSSTVVHDNGSVYDGSLMTSPSLDSLATISWRYAFLGMIVRSNCT